MNLRVLLAMHHRVSPGAPDSPGAVLALGSALADLGCRVDYFGFEQAFGHDSFDSMGSRLRFPWRLASYLQRRAGDFDVVDVSAGDGWVWGRRNHKPGGTQPILIARSDGLEQTADQARRADALAGKLILSWKYPLYHGGYRLWEVRQSLQHCDHAFLPHHRDRDFAVKHLNAAASRLSVMGNGLGRQFMGLWPPVPLPVDQPIKLISVGEWGDHRGNRFLVQIVTQLHNQELPFSLTLVGTVLDEVEVGSDFPPALRARVRVFPQCKNLELPGILLEHQVLLITGDSDWRCPTLPEMMASGVAPIALQSPDTQQWITPHRSGELIASRDPADFAAVVSRWSNDRGLLHQIRLGAQARGQQNQWHSVATRTLEIYESARVQISKVDASMDPAGSSPVPLAPQPISKPSLSICICTANRPKVLRRCLASIEAGQTLPAEVIVGDDTLDGSQTAAVCREFPFVRYVRGPRRGLCSNRNVVIASAQCDYIALLDDDSEVTPEFVRLALDLAAKADGKTIFTGDVMRDGVDRVPPSNPTFWGHFGKPLAPMGQCETVHLNCNVFPRSAFNHARFDERIVYGYEDMDLCQQMLTTGYRIEYRRELVNLHLPPPRSAQLLKSQEEQADRARYYTSLKRYMLWQSRPLRAFAYAALAPLHQAAHHLIHRQLSQALVGFSDMNWAVHQALEFRKTARESARLTDAELMKHSPKP